MSFKTPKVLAVLVCKERQSKTISGSSEGDKVFLACIPLLGHQARASISQNHRATRVGSSGN